MINVLKIRSNILNRLQLLLFLLLPLFTFAQDSAEYEEFDTVTVRLQGDTIVNVSDPPSRADESTSNVIRGVPDSVVQNYKNDPDFAYANDPAFWKKEPPADNSGVVKFLEWLARSTIISWLLYLLLAAVIIFTLYQVMVVNDFFVFSRKKKKKAEDIEHADDVSPERLDELLRSAINNGNYRLATRFLYLRTLQFLSERQLIQLQAKNTNKDYVEQMLKKEGGREFLRLTRFYEYAWYGEYKMNDEQFEYVHQHFNKFVNR